MLEAEELTLIGPDLISMGLPLYGKINPNPLKVRLPTYKHKHTLAHRFSIDVCIHFPPSVPFELAMWR